MSQSKTFLNDPGSAPVYSGVDKSNSVPLDALQCGVPRRTRAGRRHRGRDRNVAISYPIEEHRLDKFRRARLVVRSAVFVDRARRLPEISRTRRDFPTPHSNSGRGRCIPIKCRRSLFDPSAIVHDHDGPAGSVGYSSWRWNHDRSPSLRPRGARSSHCHIVHSPSKPRA